MSLLISNVDIFKMIYPEKALDDKNTYWETTIDNLTQIKEIAETNPTVFLTSAGATTSLIIRHCNNIRSKISGSAIDVSILSFLLEMRIFNFS